MDEKKTRKEKNDAEIALEMWHKKVGIYGVPEMKNFSKMIKIFMILFLGG